MAKCLDEYTNSRGERQTCSNLYNCCNCGGNNCGCIYCFSCRACEVCMTEEESHDESGECGAVDCPGEGGE